MKKMALKIVVAALSMSVAAAAAPTWEEVDGRWQVTVPEGETYTITAEDVAQIGDRPLQKAGGGTLVAGDEMAPHTKDVYVVDGIYKNATKLGFGAVTAPRGTVYVDGGTIWNTQAGGSDSMTSVSIGHALVLRGEGYRGLGAVTNTVYTANLGFNIALAGDTKIAGTESLNFRYDVVDLAGYKLTTDFTPGKGFMIVATDVRNPGDIEVRRGFFGYESSTGAVGTPDQTVTYAAGTMMRLSVLLSHHGARYVFADNTRVENVGWDGQKMDPATGLHGTKNTGFFTGPVELNGRLTSGGNVGMGVSFMGPVSGPGGFAVNGGCWLRLGGANTFAGGVEVTGIRGAGDDLCVTGGLALAANGALPATPALKLKNATLGLHTAKTFDLPDLKFDGTAVVTGHIDLASCRAASLSKTGDGALTVFGSLMVAGATDIQGGTLRFATRVPTLVPGLYWAHNTTTAYDSTADYTPEQLQSFAAYKGIDRTGLAYAYKAWDNTFATTNAADKRVDWHNNHWYAGYINIPGETGADVDCRFTSCISRNSKITIDGVVVHQVDDNKVIVPADYVDPGSDLGWRRHAWGNVVTLKAGWHRIFCYMGNHYQGGGPTSCENALYGFWPANFGLGVNFHATADDDRDTLTNKLSYVKFLDPGDGSFLATSTNVQEKATRAPGVYRPVFEGPVAFASGTALDINDVAPYTPVVFPSLTGVPTIRGGRVEVESATWTLRVADVTGGTPLTVEAAAELAFPAGDVEVDMSAEDLEALVSARKSAPFEILKVADAAALPPNAFKPSARLKAARWRLVRGTDGVSLVLASGMAVVLR